MMKKNLKYMQIFFILNLFIFESRTLATSSLPSGNSPDAIIHRFVHTNKSNFTQTLTDIGYFAGTGANLYLGALGVTLLSSFYKSNPIIAKINRTSILVLESLILSGSISQTLKWTFHRHRPNENKGVYNFEGPSISKSFLSFPSGHSSNAWSWATAISLSYDSPYLSVFCYSLATMASYARVSANKHWATDVIAGALIGYYSAKFVSKLNGGQKGKNFWPYLNPIHEDNKISGLGLYYQFNL